MTYPHQSYQCPQHGVFLPDEDTICEVCVRDWEAHERERLRLSKVRLPDQPVPFARPLPISASGRFYEPRPVSPPPLSALPSLPAPTPVLPSSSPGGQGAGPGAPQKRVLGPEGAEGALVSPGFVPRPLDYDPETGEVRGQGPLPRRSGRGWVGPGRPPGWLEPGKKRPPFPTRPRRVRTEEEEAAWREQRSHKAAFRAALEELSPALVAEGDPPMTDPGQSLYDVTFARVRATLGQWPRVSGRGIPGTTLVLSERDYDGVAGGRDVGPYLLLHVTYHARGGFRCRTRGCMIPADDARAVGEAMIAWADAFEARERKP